MSDGMFEAYAEKSRMLVERHGWMIQGVMGGGEGAPFSYTVGFSETLRHPEIFMVGFSPNLAMQLLNDLGNVIRSGRRFDETCLFDGLISDYNVAFMPIDDQSARENSGAGRYVLGRDFSAMQLFLPDRQGLFPWDSGCDRRLASMQTGLLRNIGAPPNSLQVPTH